MNKDFRRVRFWISHSVSFATLALFAVTSLMAQERLGLQDAIARALQSRASLKAASEQIAVAEGARNQARLIENPTFQFENQNLRPGQTYARDVDTYAYLNQPLDIFGKRKQRIQVASREIESREADYDFARRQVVESVKRAYWLARGTQEIREVLKATVGNFQNVVRYHAAQFMVGAIPEQDLLRIRLESERLQIDADLAAVEAAAARVELQRQMGQIEFPDLFLTEPLDSNSSIPNLDIQQVLDQRPELKVAKAALEQAQAKAKSEEVFARPDLSISYGYKRTQLVDTTSGTNTALAGFQITLPITDRNQGNREAANAEVRRRQQMLAEAEANVRADYFAATQEYELRRREVVEALQPLHEHGASISEIAQLAYEQGGTDLLRFLDAQRAHLDAELAWVKGMIEYQQSVVNLQAAEGVSQ